MTSCDDAVQAVREMIETLRSIKWTMHQKKELLASIMPALKELAQPCKCTLCKVTRALQCSLPSAVQSIAIGLDDAMARVDKDDDEEDERVDAEEFQQQVMSETRDSLLKLVDTLQTLGNELEKSRSV